MNSINEIEPTIYNLNKTSIDCTENNGYVPMVALTPSTPPQSSRGLKLFDTNNFLDPKGVLIKIHVTRTFHY